MIARSKSPARAARKKETLSPGEVAFIEAMGRHFERQGVPRIGGRILGLLLLSDEPVSLEALAERLKVSRASVSTNMQRFVMGGLCDAVSYPGDRRHYYVFADNAWINHVKSSSQALRTLVELCEVGLREVAPSRQKAKARLRETISFFQFFEDLMNRTLTERGGKRSK